MKIRLLFVTSPMLAGADVLVVQKALVAAGYRPGALDGSYGPATEHAVRIFQAVHGLTVDGAVGPKTRALLLGTPRHPAKPTAPPKPGKTSVGYLSLAEMIRHLGVKESPFGSNRQMFGIWFGVNGVPWCAESVSYATKIGAGYELCQGVHGAGVKAGKGCAYVPTIEGWLRATGMWIGRVLPVEDGLVECFNWNGGDPDHVGLSATAATLRLLAPKALAAAIEHFGPLGNGDFWSVEGNTGIGNDSNGGEQMLRKRNIAQVDGFGRLRVLAPQ
jgi:hypothetical protein